ncbi:hypothetical protein D4T97_014500 [Siminovitchia acidinfaciens]|uniref:Uncharacterized protein n=1 Tax=Siminovitchia acidinfaciens TaxID=2321395 RepID=A0A429XX87_9BACI|nr:hypothetical protein [Siminovitchia acidinfaciens]RST73086.1 hypothetical protein D4T97_014500 [Siminovitchia acidinfaciens]
MKKKVYEKKTRQETEALRKSLKKKIEAAVWLQAVGQISEAVLLSRLYFISDNPESEAEKTLLTGTWIQATGQILEALGVSREVATDNIDIIIEGQRIVITGDLLQGVGALIAAAGGAEVFFEEYFGKEDFIP